MKTKTKTKTHIAIIMMLGIVSITLLEINVFNHNSIVVHDLKTPVKLEEELLPPAQETIYTYKNRIGIITQPLLFHGQKILELNSAARKKEMHPGVKTLDNTNITPGQEFNTMLEETQNIEDQIKKINYPQSATNKQKLLIDALNDYKSELIRLKSFNDISLIRLDKLQSQFNNLRTVLRNISSGET